MIDRHGVCQGYAELFRDMCTLAGLEVNFIGGEATNSSGKTESHAWNQVKIDGTWYNVDVTWDDPTYANKNANDHTGNRYEYFLVSNARLERDHTPGADYIAEKKDCPSDYNRQMVYREGLATGLHGHAAYASTTAEIDAAVVKYMRADKEEFWLWYYDTSVTKENFESIVRAHLVQISYPAKITYYYEPSDGIIKLRIKILPVSQWNNIPVVTNVTEFLAEVRKGVDAGKMWFYLRYETNSEPVIEAESGYGFSYYETIYRNGKCKLLEIWPL